MAKQEDQIKIAKAFIKFHNTVNMNEDELREWKENELSKQASLSRKPIDRNIKLLSKSLNEWTVKDAKDSLRTVSFVARMRGVKSGEKVNNTKFSNRDIALKNWAFDPFK